MLSKAVHVDKGSSDVFTHIKQHTWCDENDWIDKHQRFHRYIGKSNEPVGAGELPEWIINKVWLFIQWNRAITLIWPAPSLRSGPLTLLIQIVQSNMGQMNTTSIHQTYCSCWQFPCQCMAAVTLCIMTKYRVDKSLRPNRQAIIKSFVELCHFHLDI